MATWKEQTLVEAPLEEVWSLLVDLDRYAEWNRDTVEVTGVPTEVELGSTFRMTGQGPLRMPATTTFKVEALEDMREIKLRCQTSGYYSRWLLTEARGNTFTEMELGIDTEGLGRTARAIGAAHTKGYMRRSAHRTLDGLRSMFGRRS
jgi:uncharacterized protein YndB with AHSA1/START domain